SSLARTIRQGVDLLELSKSGADRAIIVMSDGEAFEDVSEVVAEATRAKQLGISIVTVGFGTEQGSTIPIKDGDAVTFKKDDAGRGGGILARRRLRTREQESGRRHGVPLPGLHGRGVALPPRDRAGRHHGTYDLQLRDIATQRRLGGAGRRSAGATGRRA